MSDFRIKSSVLGPIGTNCYFVYNESTREAVIVDPADNAPGILNRCKELGIKPVAVLLTHGHCDHTTAAQEVCRAFHIETYVGEKEDALLADPRANLSSAMWPRPVSFHGDHLLRDGQELKLLGFRWKVLETPGHTAGSVCYYLPEEGVLLAGDTLFAESYGRTDLPTGSGGDLIRSITGRLFALPDDTMVYPGHGEPTTIGHEKKYNPIGYYH